MIRCRGKALSGESRFIKAHETRFIRGFEMSITEGDDGAAEHLDFSEIERAGVRPMDDSLSLHLHPSPDDYGGPSGLGVVFFSGPRALPWAEV